ncbi:sarcosine oxidase subunit gamma family protein [Pseudomonas aeruginosa]|uniref:sarcosine oxidase subunit gamma family protein n=1 Tax=Pseudomonas aeruginosa TaxID=287 RepID=UPI0010522C59|nr:sarcosine oxidase subunit gamma family protein [Pseudomonas aeruginosa]
MSKANVYQQRPEPGVHAESPLHHAELHKLAGKTAAKAGIVLREKKLLGHLVLRGDAADPAFAAQGLAQALFELSGANVRELLMKSTSYDVHPSNFPVGKAVGSIFAKSQCVIRHTGEDTWELVVRRSFADYFWLWLQDASAEYGLQVAA